jgi:hypothetical protein
MPPISGSLPSSLLSPQPGSPQPQRGAGFMTHSYQIQLATTPTTQWQGTITIS